MALRGSVTRDGWDGRSGGGEDMSDGAFTFLSWARRGLAHAVNTDTVATTTIVQLTGTATADSEEATPTRRSLDLLSVSELVGALVDTVPFLWRLRRFGHRRWSALRSGSRPADGARRLDERDGRDGL